MLVVMGCTDCTAPLDERHEHCHEVVVQHTDGAMECAGGRCRVDVRAHRFVVSCTDVGCAACEPELTWDLPLAA